jgi:flagellar motor switch protein FliG
MASDFDYTKLTRQQKLAVFLICIGPEAAADVLRQFEDPEIELLCREMSTFTIIPQAAHKQALEEFSNLVAASAGCALGGLGYAQRTLEIAKGDYKASAIVGRIGPVGTAIDVIKDISEMEGRQIFNLIKHEQPQTISFLLSYLDSAKSSEVFALLNPDLREEVIERLGTIESTSLELVGKIARSLVKHYDTKVRPAFHRSGGVRAVADLLNQLDKETSKSLLARLEERNADLSAAIRKKLFSFEDINRLQPADLQRVLREVDSSNLAISMKSASETLRTKIYAAISKRAAESLKEEFELLGPVRLKDVEAAQEAIIHVVRRLEEEGRSRSNPNPPTASSPDHGLRQAHRL